MTRSIQWTTRAASQLADAAQYLEEVRAGIGLEFVDQVEGILEAAAENPRLFPRVPDVEGPEVRRGLIRRHGYWVIYEVHPERLLVLLVWHGARRPEGWRQD